ncbi:MAG: tRNA (N6-isopentenyl adenosine(37)-C2)-methylthiotransferase MiaB [Planctomycetes bacterium RBG_13_46_10]|nr:MAG: tRNA (N6-isopentenyl adenosine(37)-C2)-methylthiotransferase MiaB [Planctomycetes bacterium RBG_13_46_10]
MSNVFIKTYGCQMNKMDTSMVTCAFKEAGFSLTDSVKDADVVLINTCSVRDHAEQRVISHLGHLKHIKKNRPDLVVAVIGCMAQRLGAELLEHEAVDIVCGPTQIPQITELVTKAINEKQKKLAITKNIRRKTPEYQTDALEKFETSFGIEDKQIPSQAFVNVMRGCDNFCSYCVVPYVRGPEVSRPPVAIIEQIRKLADKGVKQVTLLGQRVNAYKYIAGEKIYCLANVLKMASEIEGIEWLKFVTNYPSEKFFDEILQVMADCPKVCKYLHIPAQSGSDKILRAMNRRYTAEQYLDLINKARTTVPGIAIAGDFIVGFPGETEEDFKATVDLVKKARYKNCFIFKYSPRPGTTADKRLKDSVPLEVKKGRNIELLAVQEQISDELSREFLGKVVKVLVEGLSKKPHLNSAENPDKPQLIGRTETDYIVVFNGISSLAGEFVKVKITKTSPLTLFGELI